jgi:hypothetical protein
MAIAPQTAMPQPATTTRPQPQARGAVTARHAVLSPVPQPRTGGVALRLGALMIMTAFALGTTCAIAMAILTGTLTQLSS